MKCKRCGGQLDLTATTCAACGAEIELGRLTGILGIVCRACDAYNEPGAKACAACGKPLGASDTPPPAAEPPAPAARAGADKAVPPPVPPPVPGAPVMRSFQKPSTGAPTRFVPAALRPSPGAPAAQAPGVRAFHPPAPAAPPTDGGAAATLGTTCPRCGAVATQGRFCAQCGQALPRGPQAAATLPAPGQPAAPATGAVAAVRARLVVEGGGPLEGATYRLGAEPVEAGRTRGAVLFPDDPCLAPHHATFFYRGDALHVRDEGAPGGVYLRLRGLSALLRPGDHFAVGERLLRFAGLLPSAPTAPPDGTRRLGAPRPATPAVVVEEWLEGGAGGRVFVRPGPTISVGRAGCAVSLGDDPHLSQSHAEIVVEQDGTARLRDLGSSSGTYVRIPPHGERELRDGDCVRMGREVLRVSH
jgi:pSer/pThr/pTyr-binding forkhead associated (FHA) protein/ribosomal protein L37E